MFQSLKEAIENLVDSACVNSDNGKVEVDIRALNELRAKYDEYFLSS